MSRRSTSSFGVSMCGPPREMQNDARSGAWRRYHFQPCADQAGARSDIAQTLTAPGDLLQIEADAVVVGLEMDPLGACFESNRGACGTRVPKTVAHRFTRDAKDVMRLLGGKLRRGRRIHVDLHLQQVRGFDGARELGELGIELASRHVVAAVAGDKLTNIADRSVQRADGPAQRADRVRALFFLDQALAFLQTEAHRIDGLNDAVVQI